MFTGIIEELGIVEGWIKEDELRVRCKSTVDGVAVGDSIAVNGVCLTVCAFDDAGFQVQVSRETKSRVALCSFSPGTGVNLERAMKADGRLGGHIVQGHVDGVGRILQFDHLGDYRALRIEVPGDLCPYLVEKGSIAIDGISLTLNAVEGREIEIMIVPHTLSVTNLGRAQVDDDVNIEADILGKYVVKNLMAWKDKI